MLTKFWNAALALSAFYQPLVRAQFVSSLPQCVQNCINQSQDDNCKATDIGCLCRASAGNFLPDLITCMHGQCDNELDNDLLLTPLQLACDIAGAPIPESAIRNAENQASSLNSQVTTTVTQGGSSATAGSEATTTVGSTSTSVSTVTVTTTESGTTLYLIYPVTLESTTTASGAPSTVTSVSMAAPSNGFTGVIPVILTITDSAGSTYTTTTSGPGAISTYTTTNSRGSTTTQISTYTRMTTAAGNIITTTNSAGSTFITIQSPSALSSSGSGSSGSSGSSSDSSTTTVTTSVAADKTSSRGISLSKTSPAADEDATNSSPYKDTNNAASRDGVGNLLGLSILLAACMPCF